MYEATPDRFHNENHHTLHVLGDHQPELGPCSIMQMPGHQVYIQILLTCLYLYLTADAKGSKARLARGSLSTGAENTAE